MSALGSLNGIGQIQAVVGEILCLNNSAKKTPSQECQVPPQILVWL